ncbi:MAG: DUF4160 domain-containing protein [Anaerolineae bacterium]|nr:MAG: DUF4160 domain-containing protein [Anaerolineae bacterium]
MEREGKIAKFWLNPVRLRDSGGFRPHEARQIQQLVEEREAIILEQWNEYFSD